VLYKATNLRNRSLDTSNEVTKRPKCMRAHAYYKGKKTINTCFYFIIPASCTVHVAFAPCWYQSCMMKMRQSEHWQYALDSFSIEFLQTSHVKKIQNNTTVQN
jgi:hypothetical protein